MKRRVARPAVTLCLVVGLSALSAATQAQPPIVIRAKKIYTVTRGTLENAAILVEGGKIKDVGPNVISPPGAAEYRAEVVMPGMIDAHSHLALHFRGSRTSGPVTAEWRAVEHFNPKDPMIPIALSGGLTSVITRSGSGIVSSGQAVSVKLRASPDKSMILKPYVDLKMAVRPLINLRPGETPATVMGWYATASEYFRRAKQYLRELEDHRAGKAVRAPEKDERLLAFAAVLRGEVMVHAHSHYPSELMMVMHLARQYGFIDRLAFGHASEAFPIAELIAGTKAIPVIGPVLIVRFYGDSRSHNVVKELMEAGVAASIQTDKGQEQLKCFREYGALLVRHGLREDDALEALTLNGAKAMMMADRLGSIESGKDADLVLMDGHPFDLHAERIERVFVDGVLEYERREKRQLAAPSPVGPFKPVKGTLPSGARAYALANAHLFTVSRGNIPNATLVVQDGRIAAIETGGRVPGGVPILDLGGRVVMPGWVSARAFPNDWIGDLKWQVQNNEDTEPIVPEMRARFAIDPWFPSFPVIREIGITTQNITPGNVNLIGGSGAVIKTSGMDIEAMVRKEPSSIVFSLTEETLLRWAGASKIPVTLDAAVHMIRQALDGTKQYATAGPGREYNARWEALEKALEGRVPVIVHANSVAEIRTAVELAKDYRLRLIISGGVEAHKLAGDLARAAVGVILGDSAMDLEAIRGGGAGYSDQSPAILIRAGVKVSFFGPSGSRRGMPTGRLGGEPALNAAWAFRNGASEEEALRMLTLDAAEMIGLGDRIGSLDVGKDADFLVLEGHPFDYRVLPVMVFIDGKPVDTK